MSNRIRGVLVKSAQPSPFADVPPQLLKELDELTNNLTAKTIEVYEALPLHQKRKGAG